MHAATALGVARRSQSKRHGAVNYIYMYIYIYTHNIISLSIYLYLSLCVYIYIYIEREREREGKNTLRVSTASRISCDRSASPASCDSRMSCSLPPVVKIRYTVIQKCTSKGIWQQGIVSKPRNSLQKSLLPCRHMPLLM